MIDVLKAMERKRPFDGHHVARGTPKIIAGTLRVLARGIVPILLLAAVLLGPLLLWCGVLLEALRQRLPFLPEWLSRQLAPLLLHALFGGSIVIVALRLLSRRGVRLWVTPGWRTILLAWASCLAVVGVVVVILLLGLAASGGRGTGIEWIFALAAECVLFVAVPAAAVEGLGVPRAFWRSGQLMNKLWMMAFLQFVLAGLFGVVVSIVLSLALGRPWQGGLTREDATADTVRDIAGYVWLAVSSVVAYQVLRLEREGVGVEELVTVFE